MSYNMKYTIANALQRFDQRDTFFGRILKFIFLGEDETEAIALVVSPICFLCIINKYCFKKRVTKDADLINTDSDQEDWTGERTCLCQRKCRRIDIKSEEMVTQ